MHLPTSPENPLPSTIPALIPRQGSGHQFVCYGDCCSGIPGEVHEGTFASINSVVSRLRPQPEFVCFLGDEVRGLLVDPEALREQWRYWLQKELSWFNRDVTPMYHTTGNHTTYDTTSEDVFREVLSYLPRNGPAGQEGLSYFIRRGDLLLVFVNTMWSGQGDGRVETTWLDRTLADHSDARFKLVLGHHPAYPINGFAGDYQRHLGPGDRQALWRVLVHHGVLAYICSHIMAFDVQAYEGVLQVTTAGAGTLPLMPEDTEYLHCVQLALDILGLRYQVLDATGKVREWLAWPLCVPDSATWTPLDSGEQPAPGIPDGQAQLTIWRFDGTTSSANGAEAQTLLAAWTPGPLLSPFWIGLQGPERRLTLMLSAAPGRSHHYWLGPALPADKPFSIQVAVHTGMGPGGLLWRWDDRSPWSSLRGATPWGAERLAWPKRWSVGHDQYSPGGRRFDGRGLQVWWHAQSLDL